MFKIPKLSEIRWQKLTAAVTLIVTIISASFGAYSYIDNKFVSNEEMNSVLSTVYSNDKVIIDVFKSVGSSFYDVNVLRLQEAITYLENKEDLNENEKLQLNILRQFQNKLKREKALLEALAIEPLKVNS